MKKLLLPTFLFALFLFNSCKKESCWQCKIKATAAIGTAYTETTTETIVCDKTSKEIQEYQKEGSTSSNNGGAGVNQRITTTRIICTKN